ncbi:hypothetical protein IC575_018148 [Cucumis melo]|uniref:Uncharacterized protein n=1 Tax=Cucumis melo TaxID=3656 RepID=A0A9I9CQU9_CUCME
MWCGVGDGGDGDIVKRNSGKNRIAAEADGKEELEMEKCMEGGEIRESGQNKP